MRLGSIHVSDPKIRELYGKEYNGYLHNFWNIFKPVEVQHPLAMRKWQREIAKWRASPEGIAAGAFSIPSQYKLNPQKPRFTEDLTYSIKR
jgi:hypothetical protein